MANDQNPDPNTNQADQQPQNRSPKRFVNLFALIIILLSAAILLILLLMSWNYIKESKDAFGNIKELFNILLPVIGTWMGTMLAFYFSKDNFEAANKQAKDLATQMNTASDKLQTIKVKEIMINPNDSSLLVVNDEDDFKSRCLKDLVKIMDNSHSDRLPILQKASLKFIFLIYRSTIERFIVGIADGSVTITGKTITMADIPGLQINDMYQSDFKLFKDILALTGCFLPITATVDMAKQAMQDNTICQDVFITQTGTKSEKVEGWITNNMIIEKAELFKKAGH
jgi:uncharacterized Tic20 family protein